MPRVYHSSRGVLPSVMCVCDHEASIMWRFWSTRGCCAMGKERERGGGGAGGGVDD